MELVSDLIGSVRLARCLNVWNLSWVCLRTLTNESQRRFNQANTFSYTRVALSPSTFLSPPPIV